MKHFLIKYRFTNGTKEDWHREIERFIAGLEANPALKGISYRCMKNAKDTDYYHLASAADDEAVAALSQQDFFKHYTERIKQIAGGDVTVLPLEIIAETTRRA
jgi:hypothetical protein